ncbi:unnamed protein product [Closterium sp. Naga37s-1]|nr:unnamed protein product [Closterium sp. Naga37s-1]
MELCGSIARPPAGSSLDQIIGPRNIAERRGSRISSSQCSSRSLICSRAPICHQRAVRNVGVCSTRLSSSSVLENQRRGFWGQQLQQQQAVAPGRGRRRDAGRRGGLEREDAHRRSRLCCSAASSGDEEASVPGNGAASSPEMPSMSTVEMEVLLDSDSEEFFASEADDDPDRPSRGLNSISEAIEAIRRGEMVVVVDDEDRENEGDLIMAGALTTEADMAFIVRHCSGLVCVGVAGAVLDRLELPLMVRSQENDEALRTAFTVSVDLKLGTTTGISAADRAKTVRAMADYSSEPSDFRKPGHIFPLRSREGGVLKRAGHTEAAVDLSVLAGLPPVGVLCEIVNDDGTMARMPQLKVFARQHNLCLISIEDLIRYRRKREKLVERTAVARLPTQWGVFNIFSYKCKLDGIEHVAMVKGEIGDGVDVLVRVHSECLTGDIFGSRRCDCGPQLEQAMKRIETAGRGVCVYLRGHEGRGIGLGHKLQAYNLQDMGRDTVEANVDLGFPADSREYGIGAQILRDLGVRTMRLMTNNPAKYIGLKGHGLAVTGRVPVLCPITPENRAYLETKRKKMGHIYGSDMPGSIAGLLREEEAARRAQQKQEDEENKEGQERKQGQTDGQVKGQEDGKEELLLHQLNGASVGGDGSPLESTAFNTPEDWS